MTLRRTLLLLLSAAVLAAGDAAGPTPYPDAKAEAAWPGVGPIRVFDWMRQNRAHFWSQREKDQGAVVFVGDSLTAGWDAKLMAASFPGLKLANRGIGGDTSRGLLFRFKEDVLDLHPRAVVMCIGSNDLSAHANPAGIVANIQAAIAQARSQDAKLPIALCLVPPRDNPKAPTKPGAHAELNDRLNRLAGSDAALAVVDTFTPLAEADGKPKADCVGADKLHFAKPGYEAWAAALKPALAKLAVL